MSAAGRGVACALRTHHEQPLEAARPTRIDMHARSTASARHLQASVTCQRRQFARPRALPGTLSWHQAGWPDAATNAQARVAAAPPSHCATTARGGCAYQLLANDVRRAQLQPLPKRCMKELRSSRARPGRLLERLASCALILHPSARCQPLLRRPFWCQSGHEKFVSDDMSTWSTTLRLHNRRHFDNPPKVS